MKIKPLILAAAVFAVGFISHADIVVTNQVPDLMPPAPPAINLSSILSGGPLHAVQDGVSYIEGTTNHGLLQVESGVLIGEKTKHVGGFLDVYMPIGGTNSAFGAGLGIAYLDHNFYDATLNARLGQTYILPYIKVPVYGYVESGGGWNISKNAGIAQAFAGFTFFIPITTKLTFTLGGAYGTISDVNENVLALGTSCILTF